MAKAALRTKLFGSPAKAGWIIFGFPRHGGQMLAQKMDAKGM
jgi:hypothetical protein